MLVNVACMLVYVACMLVDVACMLVDTTCPVDRQVKSHITHSFSMVLTSVHLYKTGYFVSKIITVALFEKN